MFNEKESLNLSIEFFKVFTSKDPEIFKGINSLYTTHYINTKKYGENWILSFEKNIRKVFSSKNFNTNFISIICNSLNFKLFLSESILITIKDIILNDSFFLESENINLANFNDNSKIDYYIDLTNNFILKKLILVLKFYKKNLFKDDLIFNFENTFDSINNNSITGKLFLTIEDSFIFKIPSNKYFDFMFFYNNKLFTIYDSIDTQNDVNNLLFYFSISNLIYSNNLNEIKSNFDKILDIDKNKIISDFYSNDSFDSLITSNELKNINFIFNFNNNILNSRYSKNQIFILYLIYIITYNQNLINFKFIYNILNSIFSSTLNMKIDKFDVENLLIKILSITEDYNTLIFNSNFKLKGTNINLDIFQNILRKIYIDYNTKNINEIYIKNYIHSLGVFDLKLVDKIYNNLSNISLIKNKNFRIIFKENNKWISDTITFIFFENINNKINKQIQNKIPENIIVDNLIKDYEFLEKKDILNIIKRLKK
jgi:hypothetical protein